MNRRGFLQALFAVPVLAAPLLVPCVLQAKLIDAWTERSGGLRVVAVDRERGILTLGLLEDNDWPVTRIGLTTPGQGQRYYVGQTVTFPSLESMMRETSGGFGRFASVTGR